MPEDMEVGCAGPTGGPVGESVESEPLKEPASIGEVRRFGLVRSIRGYLQTHTRVL